MSDRLSYRLCARTDPLGDCLLRLLTVVAVQPVGLVSVQHRQTDAGASTTLEFVTAHPQRAALLEARLRQLVWVREVRLEALSGSCELGVLASDRAALAGAPAGRRARPREA